MNGGGGMKGRAKEGSGDVWFVFLDKSSKTINIPNIRWTLFISLNQTKRNLL